MERKIQVRGKTVDLKRVHKTEVQVYENIGIIELYINGHVFANYRNLHEAVQDSDFIIDQANKYQKENKKQ